MSEATQTVATYFDAWRNKDFDRLRAVLADDASFVGPLGRADDAEACRDGIEGLSQIVTDIVIQKVIADGSDVMTWFDLHTTAPPPCPVVNWSSVEDGRLRRIRVPFDPRPLLADRAD